MARVSIHKQGMMYIAWQAFVCRQRELIIPLDNGILEVLVFWSVGLWKVAVSQKKIFLGKVVYLSDGCSEIRLSDIFSMNNGIA